MRNIRGSIRAVLCQVSDACYYHWGGAPSAWYSRPEAAFQLSAGSAPRAESSSTLDVAPALELLQSKMRDTFVTTMVLKQRITDIEKHFEDDDR